MERNRCWRRKKNFSKGRRKKNIVQHVLVDLDMDWVVNMMDSTSRARFIALILYIV